MDLERGSFASVVASATRGAINDEATVELNGLVREMQEVQRLRGGKPKGKIALTLTLQMNDNGNVELSADLAVKRPPSPQTRAILFARKDGTLSEEDERQASFEFKEPAEPVRNIKDVRSLAANDRD